VPALARWLLPFQTVERQDELRLRYLNADRVDTPFGTLASLALMSPTDEKLGSVGGVLIDPIEREVCYFIVESRRLLRTHRYLVPLNPVRIDAEALHTELESADLHRLREVRSDSFLPFSDEDLIAALFSPRAA
jgi:hypothetical protein